MLKLHINLLEVAASGLYFTSLPRYREMLETRCNLTSENLTASTFLVIRVVGSTTPILISLSLKLL